VIELLSGKVITGLITGLITEETDDIIKVIDNPSAPKNSTLSRSSTSNPVRPAASASCQKACSKLTREEIFDLLAYVLGGGDKTNALSEEHVH